MVNPTCAYEMRNQYRRNVDAVLPNATRPAGGSFGGQIVPVPVRETVLVRANPDWATGTFACNVGYLPTLTGAGNLPKTTSGPPSNGTRATRDIATRDTTTSGGNGSSLSMSFFGLLVAIGAVFFAL